MPALADYMAQHPGMAVEATLTDRMVDLAEEGVQAASGQLVRLFPEHGGAGRPVHVIFAHERFRSVRLRSFVDFLVERFPPCSTLSGQGRA